MDWKEGLETLGKLRREGDMIYAAGKVTEPLFVAIATDERCFFFSNINELWSKLQDQILAEQTCSKAIGPNISPSQVVKEYKVLNF